MLKIRAKSNKADKGKAKHALPLSLYLLLAVLIIALGGGTLAKYFSSRDTTGSVRAKMFYFTSEFLNGSERKLSNGVTDVTFTVSNHEDELRISETDITYTVSVDPSLGVNIVYDDTMPADELTDREIIILGMTPGETYSVTVEAVGGGKDLGDGTHLGGYKKTLTGTIVVRDEEVVHKFLENKGTHVVLTVWAQGYSGTDIVISYPNGVIPDNTDPPLAKAKTNGGSITDSTSFSSSLNASHEYRFFYSGATPTIGNFTVKYDGNARTADEKKPD